MTGIAEHNLPESLSVKGNSNCDGIYISRNKKGQELRYLGVTAYRHINFHNNFHNKLWILYNPNIDAWVLIKCNKSQNPFIIKDKAKIIETKNNKDFLTNVPFAKIGKNPIGNWLVKNSTPIDEQNSNPMLIVSEPIENTYVLKNDTLNLNKQGYGRFKLESENNKYYFTYYTDSDNGAYKSEVLLERTEDDQIRWKDSSSTRYYNIGDSIVIDALFKGVRKNIFLKFEKFGSLIISISSNSTVEYAKSKLFTTTALTNSYETTLSKIETECSNNISTVKRTYYVLPKEAYDFAEELEGSIDGTLVITEATITLDGPWAIIEATWTGFYEKTDSVTFTSSNNQEPIETHPNFSEFAGTPEEPNADNGAVFNEDGSFSHFQLQLDGERNENFAGVTHYLAPRTIATRTKQYTDLDTEALKMLGKISKPAGYSLTKDWQKRNQNWLVTNVTLTQFGQGSEAVIEYLLSGENGWDPDIYGTYK